MSLLKLNIKVKKAVFEYNFFEHCMFLLSLLSIMCSHLRNFVMQPCVNAFPKGATAKASSILVLELGAHFEESGNKGCIY